MILIQNYSLAVFLCVVAMICWGSWQNTQNLIGKSWRFELFYWDFILGIMVLSLGMAFTFGSFGPHGRSFLSDLAQASPENLLAAAFGGAIWNLGTLLLVAGISLTGMSVAFPIGGGIGWLLGIFINYWTHPEGNPVLLFTGCLFILTAIFLSMVSYRRLNSSQPKPSWTGIILSVLAGLCIAFFYRFVASTLATDFDLADIGKISSYTAVVCFSIGAFFCSLIVVPIFMAYPVEGPPVKFLSYIKASPKVHFIGLLGGIIWCLGNTASFMAVGAASPAVSYGLSNSAPVVAAIWGIFVWKEFAGAPKGTSKYLLLMFISYIIGLVTIVYSRVA